MYLQFALVALLALTGIASPVPRVVDALTSPSPRATASAARDEVVDSTAPVRTGEADDVDLEEISIVVPPVAAADAVTPSEIPSESPTENPTEAPSETAPEPQANPGVVVADQLVSAERVESEVVDAAGFQTIGVTWPEGADVDALGGQVRTQTDGKWSDWIDLLPGGDAPDAGTYEATQAVRGGTDSVSIGDADAVQLAFATSPDGGPAGLSLAMVGSAETPAPDRVVGSVSDGKATIESASLSTGALRTAVAPRVISRAEWGAPAQVCTPDVASTLVGAVVHHTAGSNSYSSVAQAMQQIRNDAAYHIGGRGWCDIGYNFIVDKWGNTYEGRANSLTEAVIGVHAGGFNTGTVGVSMLGTYDAVPSAATQQAVGQIIGWRLGAFGRDPLETMNYFTSGGENSKFTNQNVSIQRIFGHRDTAYTACPGNGGYAALPNIREIAAQTARNVNSAPVGTVDAISTTNNSLTVSGWAFDPDTSGPNEVHVYIDGVGVALLADQSRPDVAAAFGIKDKHGYSHTRSLAAGSHAICVYSIDTSGGANTVLTCRTVTVGAVSSLAVPFGALDSVAASSTGILLNGWSLDPDTTSSTDVHVYIDGTVAVVRADQSRADIASIFGKGDRHGFTYQATLPPGRHDVCVHAINTGAGANTLLGCRTVVVVDTIPIGSVDSLTTTNAGISVSGWTLDQDTWASTETHVYIDGVGTAMVADQSRPDVAAAFGRGDKHGFSRSFPATPGSHGICVFGINTSGGTNVTLTCRTVVVPDSAPIGVLDAVVATRGAMTFAGWTVDPDTWASNQVHIYIDGVGIALTADLSRPDIAAAFGRGDRHGFSYTAQVAPGLRSMCVYGINTAQGANTMLNCRTVLVP